MNKDEAGTGNEESSAAVAEAFKMSLDVQIQDAGPCKKHVNVRVPRDDITHFYEAAIGELSTKADVPGFRTGHVPKKLLERRFRTELSDQVKQKVLVESLEQLTEENDLDPINEPNLDVENIEIPEEGDFEYEFDIEVRPEFDIPDYDGLRIQRPVREIADTDVENYLQRFLSQYGQLVPHDGVADQNDFVVLSVELTHNEQPLRKLPELTVQMKPVLRFQDAELDDFDKLMTGVSAGATREADLLISLEAESMEMRGETVHARFTVQDVKRQRLPELTKEFLQRIGVESEEELHGEIRLTLERQVMYEQRQATRTQVLEKITESADWDLPEQLVLRQVDNALQREVLEMQQAGFTTQQIQARENQIRQRAVSTTRKALKEHFVLNKISTQENLEVSPADIQSEITLMAMQRGESPRRVRARLEKSGTIENLEAQILERKAVDCILERAEYDDVDMEPPAEDRVEAVPHSLCGITREPAAHDIVDEESEEAGTTE